MKRTTDAVLRGELDARAKDVRKAQELLEKRGAETKAAEKAEAEAENAFDRAKAARDRAARALGAYMGAPTDVEEPKP